MNYTLTMQPKLRMDGIRRNGGSTTEDWHLLLQVFARLDGVSLGRASCACKTWSQVGLQEDLWKQICQAKWPSVDSNAGSCVVKQAGGYRQLFARRFHAQHHHAQPRSNEPQPWLSLQKLIFLGDVTVENEVVCSFIRCGHELYGAETFHFTVRLRHDEVIGKGNAINNMETLKDFRVSWAVMVRGSDRIFQVMDSKKPGHIMGNACNFSEALVDHNCCCPPGMSQHLAEVGLGLGFAEGGRLQLKDIHLTILNTLTWRYFPLKDALTYLQHVFFDYYYN